MRPYRTPVTAELLPFFRRGGDISSPPTSRFFRARMDREDIVIPADIIFVVIDELSWRADLQTLISLSQTCRVFNLSCRKHIFSRIALGIRQEFLPSGVLPLSISNMDKILSSTPSIANYVLRVTINVANTDLDGELLLLILQKLNFLTCLRLTSEMVWNMYFSENWKDINPAIERCVEYLFQIPSLSELEVSRLQKVPVSLFAAIPYVRHLRLHAATISNRLESQPVTSPDQICSPLTLLDVRGKSINSLYRIVSAEKPYVDFSGLKELYIVLEEKTDMLFLDALLKQIRELNVLAINSICLTADLSISDLMSAPSLTHIREIKLEYSEGRWNRPEHLLKATCDALLALQSKDELEKLSIQIRCLTAVKETLAKGLEGLDFILSNPEFLTLDRVALCIEPAFDFVENEGTETMTTTRADLIRHLGRLSEHPYRNFTFDFNFKYRSSV